MTQQDDLDRLLDSLPSPAARPHRARKAATKTDALDSLLDSLPGERAPRKTTAPSRAPSAAPASVWSGDIEPVKTFFRSRFNRDLPFSVQGQSGYHAGRGLDHSGRYDVALHPSSEEGRALIEHLNASGVPYRAFSSAKGLATGPHIHIGTDSQRLGSQQAAQQPDALDSLLDSLPGAPAVEGDYGSVDVIASRQPAFPARQRRARKPLNLHTVEGRREQAAIVQSNARPGSVSAVTVGLPPGKTSWDAVSSRELAEHALRVGGERAGVPRRFIQSWIKLNPDRVRLVARDSGEEVAPSEIAASHVFDPKADTVTLALEAVNDMAREYRGRRGATERAIDTLTDPNLTAGQSVTGAAGDVVDVATRPLRAASTAVAGQQRTASSVLGSLLPGEGGRANREVVRSGLYSPESQIGAVLRELTTGETAPGYESPIGEGADLFYQTQTGERLPGVVRGALDVAGDPLTYAALPSARSVASGVAGGARAVGRAVSGSRPGRAVASALDDSARAAEDFNRAGRALDVAGADGEAAARANRLERLAVREGDADPEFAARVMAEAAGLRAGGSTPPATSFRVTRQPLGTQPPRANAPLAQPPAERSRFVRAARGAADAVNSVKAVKASFDWSGLGSQGAILAAARPSLLKEVVRNTARSTFSEASHDALKHSLVTRAHANLGDESGLYLASLRGGEEQFTSRVASRYVPGVRQSERAYGAGLDTLRASAFDKYADELIAAGVTDPKAFKDIARWVNVATGRGELGRLEPLAEVLNLPFFSPRLMAARLNVVSPARYIAMHPEARKIALREMWRSSSVIGGTLALASLAGAKAGWDPRGGDFGKITAGGVTYDLTGGRARPLRFLAQMADSFQQQARGMKPKREPMALAKRFLRAYLSPAGHAAVDYAAGENFEGEQFKVKDAALESLVPIFVADLYEGWLESGGSTASDAAGDVLGGRPGRVSTGFAGAARRLPSFVGVGTQKAPERVPREQYVESRRERY